MVTKGSLAHLAVPGAEITTRVTPGARHQALDLLPGDPPEIRVRVTVPPEGGRANAAVAELLARALGVPKGRLELLRGGKARVKVWRVLPD